MARKSTATKMFDVDRYVAETAIYKLSKAYKKNTNYIMVSKIKPMFGSKWITIWPADENGIPELKPIAEYGNISIEAAIANLGYEVN